MNNQFSSRALSVDETKAIAIRNRLVDVMGAGLSDSVLNTSVASALIANERTRDILLQGELASAELEYKLRKKQRAVVIKQKLTDVQQKRLTEMFSGFHLDYSKACDSEGHVFARALRNVSESYMLDKLDYDRASVSGHGYDAVLKDVGGNVMRHINNARANVHTCCPILDYNDSLRYTRAEHFKTVMAGRQSLAPNVRDTLKLHIKSKREVVCHSISQICTVRTPLMMFLHSAYDMSIFEMAQAMNAAGAYKAVGVLHWNPIVMIEEHGIFPDIEMCFEKFRKNGRKCIRFWFKNDVQNAYEHDYDVYISHVTAFNVKIERPEGAYNYSYDLLYYRCDTVFFEMSRLLVTSVPRTRVARIITDKFMEDKTLIRYHKWHTSVEAALYPSHKHLRPASLVVPTRLLELLCSYAASLPTSKFLTKNLQTAAQTFNTRMIVNGTAVSSPDRICVDDCDTLAHIVFVLQYIRNYENSQMVSAHVDQENGFRKLVDAPWYTRLFHSSWQQISSSSGITERDLTDEVTTTKPTVLQDLLRVYRKYEISTDSFFPTFTIFAEEIQVQANHISTMSRGYSMVEPIIEDFDFEPTPSAEKLAFSMSSCTDSYTVLPNTSSGHCILASCVSHNLIASEAHGKVLLSKYLDRYVTSKDNAIAKYLNLKAHVLPSCDWPPIEILLYIAYARCVKICVHLETFCLVVKPPSASATFHFELKDGHCQAVQLVVDLPDIISTKFDEAPIDYDWTARTAVIDNLFVKMKALTGDFSRVYAAARVTIDPYAELEDTGYVCRSGVKTSELLHRYFEYENIDCALTFGAPGAEAQVLNDFTPAYIYGVTLLESHLDWAPDLMESPFTPLYGDDGSGDVLNENVRKNIIRDVLNNKAHNRIDFFGADLAISEKERDFDLDHHNQLLNAQWEIVRELLLPGAGGYFKIFNMCASAEFIIMLHDHFSDIRVVKLISSRATSTELHVVCRNFGTQSKTIPALENIVPAQKIFDELVYAAFRKVRLVLMNKNIPKKERPDIDALRSMLSKRINSYVAGGLTDIVRRIFDTVVTTPRSTYTKPSAFKTMSRCCESIRNRMSVYRSEYTEPLVDPDCLVGQKGDFVEPTPVIPYDAEEAMLLTPDDLYRLEIIQFKTANPHAKFVDYALHFYPGDIEMVDGMYTYSDRLRGPMKKWSEFQAAPVEEVKKDLLAENTGRKKSVYKRLKNNVKKRLIKEVRQVAIDNFVKVETVVESVAHPEPICNPKKYYAKRNILFGVLHKKKLTHLEPEFATFTDMPVVSRALFDKKKANQPIVEQKPNAVSIKTNPDVRIRHMVVEPTPDEDATLEEVESVAGFDPRVLSIVEYRNLCEATVTAQIANMRRFRDEILCLPNVRDVITSMGNSLAVLDRTGGYRDGFRPATTHKYLKMFAEDKLVNCTPDNLERMDEPFIVNDYCQYAFEPDVIRFADSLELNNIEFPTDVEFVQAGPGCGKTYDIVHAHEPKTSMVLLSTIEGKDDFVRRAKLLYPDVDLDRYRTLMSVLLNTDRVPMTQHLYVDEVLMHHAGAINLAIAIIRPKKISLYGDRLQIPYVNRTPTFECRCSDIVSIYNVTRTLNVSHRIPADVAFSLSDDYSQFVDSGAGLLTTNKVLNSCKLVKINTLNDVPLVLGSDTSYLTFTQAEKLTLSTAGYKPVSTVHEFQGKENDNIVVVRLRPFPQQEIFLRRNYALVAFTRHKKNITYYTACLKDALSGFVRVDDNFVHSIAPTEELLKFVHVRAGGIDMPMMYSEPTDYTVCKVMNSSDVRPIDCQLVPSDRDAISPRRVMLSASNGSSFSSYAEVSNAFQKLKIMEARYASYYVSIKDLNGLDANVVASKFYKVFGKTKTLKVLAGARYDSITPQIFDLMNVNARTTGVPMERLPVPELEQLDVVTQDCVSALPTLEDLQGLMDDVFGELAYRDQTYDEILINLSDFEMVTSDIKFSMIKGRYNHAVFDRLTPLLRTPVPNERNSTFLESALALNKRNRNVPESQGIVDINAEAMLMFNEFLITYVDDTRSWDGIDVSSKDIENWLRTQDIASYNVLCPEFALDSTPLNKYAYAIKRQPKPSLTIEGLSEYTALQTILSHTKDVNAFFCVLFKKLRTRVMAVLKGNMIINTDMSIEEFEKRIDKVEGPFALFAGDDSLIYDGLKFMEIDISKYDKSQAEIALAYECTWMRHFGMPEHYVKLWFNAHVQSVFSDPNSSLRGSVAYQRKSGDASTFFGNTMFLMGVLARSLPLRTLAAGFVDIHIRSKRVTDMLGLAYNLESKTFAFHHAMFCSKFVLKTPEGWKILPDPIKLVVKLGRRDIVNQQHLACIKASLHDNVRPFRSLIACTFLAEAVAERYKIPSNRAFFFHSLHRLVELVDDMFVALPGSNIDTKRSYFSSRANF